MTPDAAVYTMLSGDSGVTALTSTRIWVGHAPQVSSMPYISIYDIAGEHITDLLGGSNLRKGRVQIDCYGATKTSANAVAVAARAATEGKSGTYNSMTISGTWIESDNSEFISPASGVETGIHRVSFDLGIWSRPDGT